MGFKFADLDLGCPPKYSEEEYYVQKRRIYLSNEWLPSRRKRIEITLFELNLLKALNYQQLLTTKQLYDIYNYHCPVKYDSLATKLNRWSKYGLLEVNKYPYESYVFYHNIFKISNKGVKMLVKYNVLPVECLEVDSLSFPSRTKTLKLIGEQEVIINLYMKLNERGVRFATCSRSFGYLPGQQEHYGYLLKSILNGIEVMNVVEFVVTNSMGTNFNRRIDNYAKLAEANPGKQFTLVVALMDDQFHLPDFREIKSKQKMSNAKRYFRNKTLPGNLSVVVAFSSEIGQKVSEMFDSCYKEKIDLT